MSKNWWECDVKYNDKQQLDYNDDCVVSILELKDTKEYKFRDYQNVVVLDQNGNSANMSISWGKGDKRLDPSDIFNETTKTSIPLTCRVKVESDQSQFAIGGYKYTLMMGRKGQNAQQTSGGGGSTGSSGGGSSSQRYERPKAEILGSCETLFIAAILESGRTAVQLVDDNNEINALAALADWVTRERKQ